MIASDPFDVLSVPAYATLTWSAPTVTCLRVGVRRCTGGDEIARAPADAVGAEQQVVVARSAERVRIALGHDEHGETERSHFRAVIAVVGAPRPAVEWPTVVACQVLPPSVEVSRTGTVDTEDVPSAIA